MVVIGSSGSVEQPALGRRSARRPPRRFGLNGFPSEVDEDFPEHLGILDARDDAHRPATGRAGLDVDPEHPLGALRPGHRGTAFGRCPLLRIRSRCMSASPAPLGRCHLRAVFAVRRKDPVTNSPGVNLHARIAPEGDAPWMARIQASQVDPRFRYQGCQAGNEVQWLDKIAGSDLEQPKAGPKGGGQEARSKITYVVPSR